MIQRNISFSNRTQSSIFPNSLFTCQRTAAAHQRRRCFMHHFVFPVNNFFQSFFRKLFSSTLPSPSRRLRGSGIASARRRFMPKTPPFVKQFFALFSNFFKDGLQYAGFFSFLFFRKSNSGRDMASTQLKRPSLPYNSRHSEKNACSLPNGCLRDAGSPHQRQQVAGHFDDSLLTASAISEDCPSPLASSKAGPF